MKKTICLILVLSVCLALSAAAMAAGIDNFVPAAEYGDFTDVPENEWYYQSVKTANEYGLVKGKPDGTFDPDGSLTVAEAIVTADRIHMLYNTGRDSLENGEPWYQTYVDYAIEKGIIKKNDFDDYTRAVTRGEMAYIFSKAVPYADFEKVNEADNAIAPDIDGHRYEKAIKLLYVYGIVTGNDIYGSYAPDLSIKRSEMCALISRVVVPEQRREFMLMTDYEHGAVTAAVPVGARAVKTDIPGFTHSEDVLCGDAAGVAVYMAENYAEGMEGLSVLNIPRDAQEAALEESVGAEMDSHTLTFGDVTAYRFDYSLEADSNVSIAGSCYVAVVGCDLYTVFVMMPHPTGDFSGIFADTYHNMVNNVRINGEFPGELIG